MDLREQRRLERSQARELAMETEAKMRSKRSTKGQAAESEGQMSETVSEGIERVTFHLTPEDCGFGTRNMIVLDIPAKTPEWYSPRIAFFQTTSSSNGSHYRYLKNTFFPILGISNNSEKVPNLDVTESESDFFVKTGLFKTTLSVRNFNMKMEQNIPEWIDTLLTEYCNTYYQGLLDIPRETPIDSPEDYVRTVSFIQATEEVYRLFDLCIDYFSSVWQIAMSIGLSRFYGNGVWVEDGDHEDGKTLRKFKNFADFIDTKYIYTVTGHKGFAETEGRRFLIDRHAQCDFSKIQRLPIVTISGNKFYVFTGRSLTVLEAMVRSNQRYRPKGGTKRKQLKKKRLFKTRHQKRR